MGTNAPWGPSSSSSSAKTVDASTSTGGSPLSPTTTIRPMGAWRRRGQPEPFLLEPGSARQETGGRRGRHDFCAIPTTTKRQTTVFGAAHFRLAAAMASSSSSGGVRVFVRNGDRSSSTRSTFLPIRHTHTPQPSSCSEYGTHRQAQPCLPFLCAPSPSSSSDLEGGLLGGISNRQSQSPAEPAVSIGVTPQGVAASKHKH